MSQQPILMARFLENVYLHAPFVYQQTLPSGLRLHRCFGHSSMGGRGPSSTKRNSRSHPLFLACAFRSRRIARILSLLLAPDRCNVRSSKIAVRKTNTSKTTFPRASFSPGPLPSPRPRQTHRCRRSGIPTPVRKTPQHASDKERR